MVDMAYVIRRCPRGCRNVFARRLLSRLQWEDEKAASLRQSGQESD